MKRFGDFLLNSPGALLLSVLGLVALVLFCVPPLHDVAWVIGIVLVAAAAGSLLLMYVQWRTSQSRIDDLYASLAEARGTVSGWGPSTPAEFAPAQDTVHARRILELFPQGEGLVKYLRVESGFSSLRNADLDLAKTFLEEFSHSSFDNPRTHFAFMEFYRAVKAFVEFIDGESTRSSDTTDIIPGDQRTGGWHEFAAARKRAEDYADSLVGSRASFERVALEADVLD